MDEEELSDLLDEWAELWEREFERLQQIREDVPDGRSVDEVHKFGELALGAAAKAALRDVGLAVRRKEAQLNEELEQAQRAQHVQQMKVDADDARRRIAADAMKSADDLVREMSERAAQRRQEAEARRREMARQAREAQEKRRMAYRAGAAPKEQKPPGAERQEPDNGGAGAGFRGARNREASAPPRCAPSANSSPTAAPVLPKTFVEFERAWAQLEKQAASCNRLRYADVPWPTCLPTVSGVQASDTPAARKEKLRAAMLRWHPDKWGPLVTRCCEEDRAAIMESVKCVTRRILEERKRFA